MHQFKEFIDKKDLTFNLSDKLFIFLSHVISYKDIKFTCEGSNAITLSIRRKIITDHYAEVNKVKCEEKMIKKLII